MTKPKNDIKQQRAALLGMPYGTAEKHLRKSVIYELARQCGKNFCRWCGATISSPEDLAVVHIQDWSDDADRFWDLSNVAFSHVSCAARMGGIQQEVKKVERIKVTVIDGRDNSLPGVNHEGQIYVAGKEGEVYKIRIRNTTGRRLLAIPTVDGRNALTGKPGTFSDNGYILAPHESMDVCGWRQTDMMVAGFVFGKKEDSYSSQMGSPENVGVIGVAVFEEAPMTVTETHIHHHHYPKYNWIGIPPYLYPIPQTWVGVGTAGISGDAVFGSEIQCSTVGASHVNMSAAVGESTIKFSGVGVESKGVKQQEIGTEYGKAIASAVTSALFQRATERPCEICIIRYDTMESLIQAGIMRPSCPREPAAPSPFPQEPAVSPGYCQPPARQVRR